MIQALSDWNGWWNKGNVDSEMVGRMRELSNTAEEMFSYREIKTLTGMRRTGKSTILYQFIYYLLDNGIAPERILFVNFEDPILSKHTLEEIFKTYQSKVNPDEKPYVFLDEIHRCEEWVQFIRKIYDLRKVEQVFITDSSSKFVRAEYAGILTGRKVNIHVSTLSFTSFLSWNGIDDVSLIPKEKENKIKNLLSFYLQWGGLPEVVLRSSEVQRRTLLNNYFEDIIYKDIVERHNTNPHKVSTLADFLVSNNGTLFSPRKYSRTHGLSLDAINTYIRYMEDVFLFHSVSKFDFSLRKQQINPKKMYLLDTGFFGAASSRFMENQGRVYENAVLIHLLRRGKEAYYWKGEGECDFIVTERGKPITAIQVCYSLNRENRERELRGLKGAMDALNIKEGIIINSEEDRIEGDMRYIPLWKYLLV